MPSYTGPSRRSDALLRRASAPLSIILSAGLMLVLGGLTVWQGQSRLQATQAMPSDASGLLSYVGLTSGPAKSLYELSSFDRALYKQIFVAQEAQDWRQANALSKRLHDKILMGHVLYARYMDPDYKADYNELRRWMVSYGDLPDAYKIYQLAQKRRDNNPDELPAPQIAKKLFGSLELKWLIKENQPSANSHKPVNRDEAQVQKLIHDIKDSLADEKVTRAYNMLGDAKIARQLTTIEYDSLLSEIAAQYYYSGKQDAALKLANQAIARSKQAVPVAHWIAGLSSWKNQDYAQAAHYFEGVSKSISHNPWMLSAGAFWTARSYQKLHETALSNNWLQEAANYPRTFYGLIAKSKLGSNDTYSWSAPQLTSALTGSLNDVASGRRALALLDIGQTNLAQKELLQTHPNGNQRLEKALVAVAHHFNLAELALRLGNAINQPDGKLYDVALYPLVPWKGDTSAGIDQSLINALIRQESKFDPNASNERSGAKGLMQLMPSTAQFVSDKNFDVRDMHKPDVNVALGQRYVRYLLKTSQVQSNLVYLAAAYNAGPGNLAKWQKKIGSNDPFLFIESMPWSETRGFVARVMTNYWIYNQRLAQENATLESLGKENWPLYVLAEDGVKLASN